MDNNYHHLNNSGGSGRGNLQILAACPLCQATYNPLKTKIVGERDDAHLLYLECRQCGSAVIALITAGLTGLNSIGAITDLTSGELFNLADENMIGDDDVLELHRWLQQDRSRWAITRFHRINS